MRIPQDLKLNDKGDQVKLLQSWLASDPSIYKEGTVSGTFGKATQTAVVKFQERYASDILMPQGFYKGTGVVDEYTRNKLNELYGRSGIMPKVITLTSDMRQGDSGEEVRLLQTWLAKDATVYPEGITSGYFGPLTKQAVARFQEKYSSEVLSPSGKTRPDGEVDRFVADKLNSLYGKK